ncbi:MAG TPA: hypothetical protein VJX29_06020 [Candidatus Acidoferrales bacterium]|nr:hypothetical protein [Candidatus Acidoferrales bacterium]
MAAESRNGETAPSRQVKPPTPPAVAPSPTAVPHPPVVFTPRYTPGETLRYQVSFRSQTKNQVGGAVENPEGATELGIEVGLTLRLEVLPPIPTVEGAAPAAGASDRPSLRLRAVYEHVSAKLSGDSYDPAAAKLLAQYQHLEGRAIEFQLGPHGEMEYVKGLEEVVQDPRALEAARAWIEQLGAGLSAPQNGAVPGQSWKRSQPVPDAPLAGTSLQTISTYLRDEACDVEKPAGEQCAVVLTRFTLGQKAREKNATPETFRRQGLRTSGEWTSHGESLVYVSLLTGRTVSVTQSSEVVMDLSIWHEDGGMPFHFAGASKTETHLLLLSGQPGQ